MAPNFLNFRPAGSRGAAAAERIHGNGRKIRT
jgi:hypothetical protein